MKVIEIKGCSTVSKGLKLYLSKLLKKAVPNTVISFRFGEFDGKLKFQNCVYDSAKYACVLRYSERCTVKKYVGARKSFDGLCKPYDYNSNIHVTNTEELYDGLWELKKYNS